jgi:L-ribulokinase
MSRKLALGVDYGTNSCRSLLVDLVTGEELASHVFPYPSGEMGILTDPKDPHVARQNPRDYLDGLETVICDALDQAKRNDPAFDPSWVTGIGIDTTGSTVIPIDETGTPLGMDPAYSGNLNAQVWLWKDHTAHAEAAEITATAEKLRPHYLAKCGGIYSSEWWWSKILHLRRIDPAVFAASHSFVEHCDWIPAVLTGNSDPATWKRGICSAGHKAMYADEWGGLPDEAFLAALHPDLAALRGRLYDKAWPSTERAGGLCREWADKLGLPEGTAVAVGAFDAHMGAVGGDLEPGTLLKIMGTSTCDIMVGPKPGDGGERLVRGICGQVDGSVIPGMIGYEAGQSAFGDVFAWLRGVLAWPLRNLPGIDPGQAARMEEALLPLLEEAAAKVDPERSGLTALDWLNGRRTPDADQSLKGAIYGINLGTDASALYRALIEAAAFGSRAIVERMRDEGLRIDRVAAVGGVAKKSPLAMQISADVLGMEIAVSSSEQSCALGASMFAAVAAGLYPDILSAQAAMRAPVEKVWKPDPGRRAVYDRLYRNYRALGAYAERAAKE